MKKSVYILIFSTLLILLVGFVSASEVTENTGNTNDATETTVQEINTVYNTDTTNVEKSLETENNLYTVKNTNNLNKLKEGENPSNWKELEDAVNNAKSATENTTIILKEGGTYTTSSTITWDKTGITLTIDGNGQTINGRQWELFIISNECSLILKNIIIQNNTKSFRAVIYNDRGTLTIYNSTFKNNTGQSGGAIYNDRGTLTIYNSTFKNNTGQWGGVIYNDEWGTLTIYNSTFKNNQARDSGGVIYNGWDASLNVIDSTFENNTATYEGGAIYSRGKYYTNIFNNIITSNFTQNKAANYSAIISLGYLNLTGCTFKENTATNNKETLSLGTWWNGLFKDNHYLSTDVNLSEIKLSLKDDKQSFNLGEEVVLNFTITPTNVNNYNDVSDEISDFSKGLSDITLYINNTKNVTTKYENYTLPPLDIGTYEIYFTTCNQQSNTITFTVKYACQISTDNKTYTYYNGTEDNINIDITDESGKTGTVTVSVKENGEYINLLTYNDVKDKYTIPVKEIGEKLKELYENQDFTYTINIEYCNDYVNPNSTEITLKILKNTNITLDNVEAYVGDEITLKATITDDNNNPINTGKVVFKINGKTIGTAKVRNGIATYNTTVPKSWTKEGLTLYAKYGGNSYYQTSNNTTTITIKQKTANIKSITTGTYNSGEEITLTAIVTDTEEKLLDTGYVIFKLNGLTIKDNNNKTLQINVTQGLATVQYTLTNLVAKNYTITAVFTDDNYERTENTSKIIVTKANIHIEADSITVKDNEPAILTAKILDSNNNPVNTPTKITIKINGITFNTTTIKDGTIQITLNQSLNKKISINDFKTNIIYNVLIIAGENSRNYGTNITTVLIKD